jgi:hypothetical protein
VFGCVLLHFAHVVSRIERGLVIDLSCGDESVTVVAGVSEVGSPLSWYLFVRFEQVLFLPQVG